MTTNSEFFNNPICSDFLINILGNDNQTVKIYVSKYILYKQSDFFKNLMSDFTDNNQIDIVLTEHYYGCDVTIEHVIMFLRALYEVINYDDKWENLYKLITIANYYGSLSVIDGCVDILLKNINDDIANDVIKFMGTDMITEGKMKILYERAESLIIAFARIHWFHYDMGDDSLMPEYRKMPYQAIRTILKNELTKNLINANILFNFVIDWILYDHNARGIYMKNFLPLIKFSRMEPFYIRYFLFECFGKYFPNELPVLENIIACTEFFRIYSNENLSMNDRLSKEFDIKNFHGDMRGDMRVRHEECELIMDKNTINSLITERNYCYSKVNRGDGFLYEASFEITDIPSDDLNKYIYFDPIKRKLSEKVIDGKKLYWNMYVKIYKPFNPNRIFTNEYFYNYTVEICIIDDIYETRKLSDCVNSKQYLCTLFEFDPDNNITFDDLTRACKIINGKDYGENFDALRLDIT